MQKLFRIDDSAYGQPQNISAPGKLYISGEYAVLFPEQLAIIVAVDQALHVEIAPSSDGVNHLYSSLLSDVPLLYQGRMQMNEHLHDWRYVTVAIMVSEKILYYLGIKTLPCELQITSELNAADGSKYGLGSSGAVVIALIKAYLAFHGVTIKQAETLYRAGVIAMMFLGSNGSFGDLAAISYGGWILYQTVNRSWLQEALANRVPFPLLMTMDWPGLNIEQLKPAPDLELRVAWTGQSASTENLVNQLMVNLTQEDPLFTEHLQKAHRSVQALALAIQAGDYSRLQGEVNYYQSWLDQLAATYQLELKTAPLAKLIAAAQDAGYAAKASGAGGGDCGIAIGQANGRRAEKLKALWQSSGIESLDLQVSPPHDYS